MIFKLSMLQAIQSGEVQLAFRRWTRPTVKAGTHLRTAIGVVAIDRVERIDARDVREEDARLAGFASTAELFASLRSEGALYRIALRHAGADPRVALRSAKVGSASEMERLLAMLEGMDRRARQGPFVERLLDLIERAPATLASNLATEVGMEKAPFKAQVRRLKELGLTESLEVGYRLSARGREVLAALRERKGREADGGG